METMYCLKITKEIYIPNVTEKEATKMLNDLVNKEYRNANNKIQIHSEVQLCL